VVFLLPTSHCPDTTLIRLRHGTPLMRMRRRRRLTKKHRQQYHQAAKQQQRQGAL